MKYYIYAVYPVVAMVAIAACVKPTYNSVPMVDYSPVEQPLDQRVTITRLGVFKDELAYDNKRGIYLIVDTKTDIEYIGISGIGISEVGSHRSGKSTFEDER